MRGLSLYYLLGKHLRSMLNSNHNLPREMRTPALPQELIDCIIDDLGSFEGASNRECRQALKACSLASPSFLSSSRKYLFTEVRLQEEDTFDSKVSSNVARILDVLVNDSVTSLRHHIPPLASHIHSLSIIFSQSRAFQNLKIHSSQTPDFNIIRPSTLPAILQILIAGSPINSFSMEFPSVIFHEWPYVDAQLKADIEFLCRSPSITTLRFRTIHELPTTLITGCPNLKVLHLYFLSAPVIGTPNSINPTTPSQQARGRLFPHLESLVLSGSQTQLMTIFLADSLPRLQHIQLLVDVQSGITARELEVMKRAPCLQSITLNIYCHLECESAHCFEQSDPILITSPFTIKGLAIGFLMLSISAYFQRCDLSALTFAFRTATTICSF